MHLLAERAYVELRGAILSNRLVPGSRLSVPELARQMNVSRSPVREAVQRLIHEGLATHVSYRGAEVAKVEVQDLRSLYVVREVLEGLAARLATERLDAATLARLRELIDRHEEVLATGQGELPHIEMDTRYHRMIRELAGNRHLTAILDTIQGKAHMAAHSLWRGRDAPRLALDEHKRILEAMARGDPDEAELAARAHVARLRVRLSQAIVRGWQGQDSRDKVVSGP